MYGRDIVDSLDESQVTNDKQTRDHVTRYWNWNSLSVYSPTSDGINSLHFSKAVYKACDLG